MLSAFRVWNQIVLRHVLITCVFVFSLCRNVHRNSLHPSTCCANHAKNMILEPIDLNRDSFDCSWKHVRASCVRNVYQQCMEHHVVFQDLDIGLSLRTCCDDGLHMLVQKQHTLHQRCMLFYIMELASQVGNPFCYRCCSRAMPKA